MVGILLVITDDFCYIFLFYEEFIIKNTDFASTWVLKALYEKTCIINIVKSYCKVIFQKRFVVPFCISML